ncbi:MAG: cytochrome c [Betaproteobacteria bacterium]|nr:c-type cytochrome [Betaproteobacteria bacterium]MDE2423098.1 cytochrome c [Betaproteobacteria bacterium]
MGLNKYRIGEKVLFGVIGLIAIFAIVSFVGLEIYRSHLKRPMYQINDSFDFTEAGLRGSVLFRDRGCTSCHRAVRNGTNNGVDLDGVGSKRNFIYLLNFLHKPEATYESKTVDHGPFKEAAYVANLPEKELNDMATFLSELKARQGAADSPMPMPERSGFVDEMVSIWAPKNWKNEHKDLRIEAGEPPAK